MGLFTRNQKGEAEPSGRGSRAGQTPPTRRKNGAAGRDEAVADDLRRRARRRLIGAVAMVLAAVIILPMVLDAEREPLPDDVAIQIPSRNTPFQQDLVAVAPPGDTAAGAQSPSDAAAPSPSPAAPPVEATPDPRLPASLSTITPVTPSTPAPREETQPPPKPREPARPAPEPPPPAPARSTPPNAAAAQKEAEAARALALLQGKTSPAPAPAPRADSSRFAVQVVAVRSREGADALLNQLRGAGLAAYIETIKTPDGQVHRVRLGPYNSRSQAESAQAKLRGLPGGYSGSLVPL